MTTTQLTSETWKKKALRYLHSSAVTYIAFFLLGLYLELKANTFDDIWTVGWIGLVGVVVRLLSKAAYETALVKLPAILKKLGVEV